MRRQQLELCERRYPRIGPLQSVLCRDWLVVMPRLGPTIQHDDTHSKKPDKSGEPDRRKQSHGLMMGDAVRFSGKTIPINFTTGERGTSPTYGGNTEILIIFSHKDRTEAADSKRTKTQTPSSSSMIVATMSLGAFFRLPLKRGSNVEDLQL